jgi:hypothetical protein
VYQNIEGLPVVAEFPINRWVRNGPNELSLYLRPAAGRGTIGKDVKCVVIVYQREKSADRETRREVARVEYPKMPATRRDGDEILASTPFSAVVPFGLFRWFTAPEIADGDVTLSELLGELEKYHALFTAKDIDAILNAVRERDREDAMANYATLADQAANSRREYSLYFSESEYELRPLITQNVRLRLFGNRRLARVELLSNGQPPLYYLTADHRTAGYLTMIFCRDAGGKWVVIR